jgi:outer membrane protein OmpA-like peptidoglycan-associated protein
MGVESLPRRRDSEFLDCRQLGISNISSRRFLFIPSAMPITGGTKTTGEWQMRRRSLVVGKALGLAGWFFLVVLALPGAANAGDFSLKLEPGLAIPLSDPQSQIYDVGGGESLKALFGINPYFDVGPTAFFLFLPAANDQAAAGGVWGFGGGLRIKRPHVAESVHGLSPWLDADFFLIQTGNLNRPGFDLALGVSAPLGRARRLWIGPFVRYLQVIQPDHAGFDDRDAKILTIGLSFEIGTGIKLPVAADGGVCSSISEVRTETKEVISCPDSDGDSIPDTIDRCPDVPGEMENWGCPHYDRIIVRKDKLELKEKLYFAWDQATLEDASFPVLDEVVRALKDNKSFRVQIEGNADSTGPEEHNQTLSEGRAQAVLDYLVAHGIAKDRLGSKGLSSSKPLDTNATAAGRENNRRVEFVVRFAIVKPGSAK